MTHVDGDDNSTKDGDPNCNVEIRSPILNDQSSGRKVRRGDHDVLEKVIPAGSEAVCQY